MRRFLQLISSILFVSFAIPTHSQQPPTWTDPSPHTTRFVNVADNVQLEVLDWGGSGRPLVLLAGLGNTAHVFDDFAPKLTPQYHVYGITRRGFGASSAPDSGYSADQLGDDVLAVMNVLKLEKPVLIGHSLAGEELSSVGTRHPAQVAGLVYLDAVWPYTYYTSRGDTLIDLLELQKKLGLWLTPMKLPDREQYVKDLLQELPQLEKDLQRWQKDIESDSQVPPPPPSRNPTDADKATFAAFQSWTALTEGLTYPEAELRQMHERTPDGGVGKRRNYSTPAQAITQGAQKYTGLRVPALAICAIPHDQGPTYYNDETGRKVAEAIDAAQYAPIIAAFESAVPSARVVRLARADHYVFLSNEQDVLRELRAFLARLQ
jgi:pimeloyl-ACP methyl ester carboxylesterase